MEDQMQYYSRPNRIRRFLVSVVIIIVFAFAYRTMNPSGMVLALAEYDLTCTADAEGAEPVTIDYRDILSITYMENIDIGEAVNSTDGNGYYFGRYENDAFGEYTLCAYQRIKGYAVFETTQGIYVINYESKKTTQAVVESMQEYIVTLE